MKKYLSLIAIALLVLCPVAVMAGLLSTEQSLEGMVVRVAPDMITVISQLEEGAKMVEIEIKIVPETKLEKVTSLEGIKEGDVVKINYTQQEEDNIGRMIERVSFKEEIGLVMETPDI